MPPLEINSYTYWTRARIIFDIVNNCFKEYSPIKIVTSDDKKYSLISYEKHLDKLAEKYRNIENIPNEICVAATIKKVFQNKKVLFQNNGTCTMQSDADIRLTIYDNICCMVFTLLKEIKAIHLKGKSLSLNYDLNIYLESPDEVYEHLVKTTLTKETIKIYKDNINLKLIRHGKISANKCKKNTSPNADFEGAELYKKFNTLLEKGNDQKNLIKAEQELYEAYFRKILVYAHNPTLKSLAEAHLYAIEAYTSILTLMYLYTPDKIKFTDEMIQIVVLENISDMMIHLSDSGYIKKAKYLKRATRAMMAIGLHCHSKQTNIINTLYSFSTIFEKTRHNLIYNHSDYDNSVKVLLMQILHQVDPSVGRQFNPIEISNPDNNIKNIDIEKAALKIITNQKGFKCNSHAAIVNMRKCVNQLKKTGNTKKNTKRKSSTKKKELELLPKLTRR